MSVDKAPNLGGAWNVLHHDLHIIRSTAIKPKTADTQGSLGEGLGELDVLHLGVQELLALPAEQAAADDGSAGGDDQGRGQGPDLPGRQPHARPKRDDPARPHRDVGPGDPLGRRHGRGRQTNPSRGREQEAGRGNRTSPKGRWVNAGQLTLRLIVGGCRFHRPPAQSPDRGPCDRRRDLDIAAVRTLNAPPGQGVVHFKRALTPCAGVSGHRQTVASPE